MVCSGQTMVCWHQTIVCSGQTILSAAKKCIDVTKELGKSAFFDAYFAIAEENKAMV